MNQRRIRWIEIVASGLRIPGVPSGSMPPGTVHRLLIVFILGLSGSAGFAANLDDDPVPHASVTRSDFRQTYITGELGNQQDVPVPRNGTIRFQMRLMNHKLVAFEPHSEFYREFELIRTLVHPKAAYRIAAMEELARFHPTVRVARAITRRLSDVNREVRERAAYALGKFDFKGSIEPLIDMLMVERGGVAQTVADSLQRITGNDFGTDYEMWWSWYRKISRHLYMKDFALPKADPAEQPVRPEVVQESEFGLLDS